MMMASTQEMINNERNGKVKGGAMIKCPKCESEDIMVERSHGGDAFCRSCSYKGKTCYFVYDYVEMPIREKRPYQEKRTYVKDCNGVEIYEGDDVEIRYPPKDTYTGPHKVVFEEGSFGVNQSLFVSFSGMRFSNAVIILVPKDGE